LTQFWKNMPFSLRDRWNSALVRLHGSLVEIRRRCVPDGTSAVSLSLPAKSSGPIRSISGCVGRRPNSYLSVLSRPSESRNNFDTARREDPPGQVHVSTRTAGKGFPGSNSTDPSERWPRLENCARRGPGQSQHNQRGTRGTSETKCYFAHGRAAGTRSVRITLQENVNCLLLHGCQLQTVACLDGAACYTLKPVPRRFPLWRARFGC
jgi:hypothetical protein